VGAVNTFWLDDGALVGDNTDVDGFLELMDASAPGADGTKPAAVLGAGGSAAAVITALDQRGFAEIRVHSRTAVRAAALGERFASVVVSPDEPSAVDNASLVVNATPVGLDDVTTPIDVELLHPSATVLDLVVGRNETPLVRAARARGHRAADGLQMLLGQGALAFERWFGITPDRDAMRQAVAR
jgi:shikimate dehydrogenase